MNQTVEAVIEPGGAVRLLEVVKVARSHRALVTILDEEPAAPSLARRRIQLPLIEGTPGNVVNPSRTELDAACLGGDALA